jgi:aminopeptidase N
MIRATLGEEIFQKGMQNYLQKYAFETADHIKYFDALTEVFLKQIIKKTDISRLQQGRI